MPPSDYVLLMFLSLPVIATLLSLSKSNHWTLRIFDFPRLQIAAISLLCMLFNHWFQQSNNVLFTLMEGLNFICAIWQIKQIAAYTPLYPTQVKPYTGQDNARTISILTCNFNPKPSSRHIIEFD
ncbi:MAG: hypothetical protein Q4B82_00060 [Alysiella sp.]|nr:hypothetical protein [Alysiella sp.]